MENKDNREYNDYRETIGRKLAEAMKEDDFADLEDLIEMPSRETFDSWVAKAEERQYKKFRIRRYATICAAVLLVVVGAAIVLKGFALPSVEADPDDNVEIEKTMETSATYSSWDKLPTDIKEQFVEFTDFPEGYEVEKIVVEDLWEMTIVEIYAKNDAGDIMNIKQTYFNDGTLDSNVVADGNESETWEGVEVSIEKHTDKIEKTTYKFVKNNIVFDVYVSNDMETYIVREFLKAALN